MKTFSFKGKMGKNKEKNLSLKSLNYKISFFKCILSISLIIRRVYKSYKTLFFKSCSITTYDFINNGNFE